jgi:hypothetical protein
MHYTATRLIVLSAAMITLTLLIYMAQPWGNNYAYQSLSGYAWLLSIAVWATLPYLMVVIGTLIISLGGVALYLDAAFLHQDPQGGLVFIAVPLYQWIILGFLTGFHFLICKKQS